MQDRNRRLRLIQRALGLVQLQFGCQAFCVKMFEGGEQLLSCVDLMPGYFQACLKATDAEVEIGCDR